MNIGHLSRYTRITPSTSRRLRVNSPSMYNDWSREELIARLTELDKPRQLSSPQKTRKEFQFSAYPKRKIALKFCYSGWEYGGLAFQNMPTSLPTVEGVLFDALVKARLIDPTAGFEGCGWEKCGRTDRGVSAAGQVISLWIRSALESQEQNIAHKIYNPSTIPHLNASDATSDLTTTPASITTQGGQNTAPELQFGLQEDDNSMDPRSKSSVSQSPSRRNIKYEHDYLAILNRLLPPTIRIIAWSPVSTNFSARFSCAYRHYKYFFSSETSSGTRLDIDRMRAAASRLIGEHDFRNMCKLDPAKQITTFRRNIIRTEIEPVSVDLEGRGVYVFNLVGSAFLYHQVRHIMAILFMIGHGQEDPTVVTALMNVERGSEPGATEVVPSKPEYQMADPLPLLLWDCGYPEGELDWRTTNKPSIADGSDDRTDLYQQLHAIHSRSQIYTTLNDQFLAAASRFHPPPLPTLGGRSPEAHTVPPAAPGKLLIPLGGGTYKRSSEDRYTPLLIRNRLDPVDQANERWRLGKGFRRNEKKKAAERNNDGGDE